ncbi:hypothetical protein FRC05_010502 [Tulasnella sp. 425]|nr:hypothetical protein FRC05_010502 [Tulasnella sp. 425]
MSTLSEWMLGLHMRSSSPTTAKAFVMALSLAAIYKLAGHVLREYIIIPKTTILKDIDSLHTPRRDGKIPGRVVVCGGSIAGLLAAAVCADHFESVTIIEAEAWANERGTELPKIEERVHRATPNGHQTVTAPRTRVMQYYFSNFFQPPVYTAFTRLFPQLTRILDELNLGHVVRSAKVRVCFGGLNLEDPYPEESSAANTACLTREATEVLLRKAVKESRPNVTFRTGTVSGFLREGDSLKGVTARVNGAEEPVEASFVIDAAGPGQMSYSKWLRNAGVSVPSHIHQQYDALLRYTATVWTIPPHLHSKWPAPWGFKSGLIYTMSPDAETGDPKALGFCVAENNQMHIMYGGASIPNLPHSVSELRAYANDLHGVKSIPDWVWRLFDFMEEHEEECKPFWADSRIPPLSWVQWHKIANDGALPRNWIAVGDATMTLNPLYGHGIYKACVDATTLNAVLHSIPASSPKQPNLPALFYKKATPRISSLWDGGRANDYGWPNTIPIAGEELSHNSWMRKYVRSCMILAQNDPELRSIWWHVAMLLSPGTDLFAPWILFKVARYHMIGCYPGPANVKAHSVRFGSFVLPPPPAGTANVHAHIAGLLAAAVCADHFESVVVVEAETWASEHGTALPKIEGRIYRTTPSGYQTVTAPRTRVPQYYFGNLFQPPVFTAFNRLFPGLPQVIDTLNIGSAIVVAKLRMSYGGLDLKDPYTDEDAASGAPIMPCLTREATEVFLRKAVKESRPNVVFKTGTVSGFLAQEKSLKGVTVRENGVERQEQADFVIDATGPSQVSYSKWLRSAGFSLPSDLRVEYDPILRYAASVWTIPEHLHSKWPVPWGFKCGYIYTLSPDAGVGDPKALGIAIAENNQMVMTIGGPAVTDLPHSLPELRAYANGLYAASTIPEWVWQLFDFMEEYEEECKPFWADYRVPPMSWVQWYKIAKIGALPRNWIAVGDANMILNPFSAQGIYKACIDATTLNAVLHSVPASSFTGKLPNIPGMVFGLVTTDGQPQVQSQEKICPTTVGSATTAGHA